ncbi:MAG: carotenoid oxygenase family protein [Bacteroidia bacterium]|nr:carotenoid oxygenase family protein [Bacteroidia bacterium]
MKKQLFSSLTEEISQPLVTRGSIPGWLNGVFMRNGPAKFEQGETKITSWGDGYAMLHKFVLNLC